MKSGPNTYAAAALLLPALTLVPPATALKDGLAQTPQMGWGKKSFFPVIDQLTTYHRRILGIPSTATFRRK